MNKRAVLMRRVVVAAVVAAVFVTFGCVQTAKVADKPGEVWEGRVSGMADGSIRLIFQKPISQGVTCSVVGEVNMKIESVSGGYGSGILSGQVRGEIIDGVLKAKISGYARVSDGDTAIAGVMEGRLAPAVITGSWRIKHREGLHAGQWTAQRVDAGGA